MGERVAYVNGQIVPEREAKVSVFDRGFLSGHGVYERTRTFRGELFRLDVHIARLYRSLWFAHIDLDLPAQELTRATLALHAKNRPLLGPDDDYLVGHYVSRGLDGGGPTTVIFTEPIKFRSFAQQYVQGAHVVTPSIRQVPVQCVDPKVKSTSHLHFWLAEQEARLSDPDAYALLLDLDGNVTEVSPGGNFWIVEDGELVSPSSRAILRGVTRDVTFEVAKSVGIPTREQDFQLYDVTNADEALITTTSKCVVPVTRCNGRPIGAGSQGPIVSRLQRAWAQLCGVDFVQQALNHVTVAESTITTGPGEIRTGLK